MTVDHEKEAILALLGALRADIERTRGIVFHRRQRLAPLGGSSFYRDRRVRESKTVCGAACTSHDRAHHDRSPFRDWTRDSDGQRFVACPDCG